MKHLFIALLWSVATASAQTSDCLIDLTTKLPSFEPTMGYSLNVADDGTEFKPAEKVAFNQVAAVLPAFYRNMKTLSYFERVPDGYVLENGAVGEYDYSGWKIGRMGRLRGRIYLAERTLKTAEGRFEGEFHWNIIHEMSHAFDQQLDSFSETDEWRGLSTWDAEDKGTSKNFITWYAPSSPSEDFAESMAAFIISPDDLLKVAPTKFELISRKFYGGRKFDTQSRMAFYQAQLNGLEGSARDQKIRMLRSTDYYACKLLPLP